MWITITDMGVFSGSAWSIKCRINEFKHIRCLKYLLSFFSFVLSSRQWLILFFRSGGIIFDGCGGDQMGEIVRFLTYVEEEFVGTAVKQLEARPSLRWVCFNLGLSFSVLFILRYLFGQHKLVITCILTTFPVCLMCLVFFHEMWRRVSLWTHRNCLNLNGSIIKIFIWSWGEELLD